jgi:hypothetical protein
MSKNSRTVKENDDFPWRFCLNAIRLRFRESFDGLQRTLNLFIGQLIGCQFPGEVGLIGRHIHQAVTAPVEQNDPLLTHLTPASNVSSW